MKGATGIKVFIAFVLIVGLSVLGYIGVTYGFFSNSASSSVEREEAREQPAKLQLLSCYAEKDYDYFVTKGEVKNIGNQRLENVVAVATWYTSEGTFVVSDEALLDYNPIMPGQASPFDIYTSYNPLMARYSIEFRFLLGQKIESIR